MAKDTEFKHIDEWPAILKVAGQYNLSNKDKIMLLAIRECENGKEGYQFGVKLAKGTNLETQAKWCAGSIRANRDRYNKLMIEGVYVGARRTICIEGTEENNRTRVNFVKPSIDFVTFMGHYGGLTGMGYAPIHTPEMSDKERELNRNWVPNVKMIMTKIEKYFNERGVDEYGV